MKFIGKDEDRASWATHFAQVKAKIKQPKRSHEVRVRTKKGGNYTFKYADLADVDRAVMDAIKQVKDDKGNCLFSYLFDIDNGAEGVSVQTLLIDASTGYTAVTNKVWFKNYNVGDAQGTAGLISYAKRYSLSAAFGIASEDDDDAKNLTSQQQNIDADTIKTIWDAYINDHNTKARTWILSDHGQEANTMVKELISEYNAKQAKAKREEHAKEEKIKKQEAAKQKEKPKPVPAAKPESKQADSKEPKQADLFGDILGD